MCLGFQDFSQLTRGYGDKESKVIQNTVGNIFSGQVVGETAKNLSERFGKVLQKRQSMTINRNDKSTSISTQMDSLIPASKISNLDLPNEHIAYGIVGIDIAHNNGFVACVDRQVLQPAACELVGIEISRNIAVLQAGKLSKLAITSRG